MSSPPAMGEGADASRGGALDRAGARGARQGAWRATVLGLLALLSVGGVQADTETIRVAVLDVELLKPDHLPDAHRITDEERRRLDAIAALVRRRLRDEGYRVVSEEDTKRAIGAAGVTEYLHQCNGCERDIARALDADWVAVGWVQLVSYLIVNLNVVVHDVESGEAISWAFVDLRGTSERSWRRATTYMLDNILVERLARISHRPAR